MGLAEPGQRLRPGYAVGVRPGVAEPALPRGVRGHRRGAERPVDEGRRRAALRRPAPVRRRARLPGRPASPPLGAAARPGGRPGPPGRGRRCRWGRRSRPPRRRDSRSPGRRRGCAPAGRPRPRSLVSRPPRTRCCPPASAARRSPPRRGRRGRRWGRRPRRRRRRRPEPGSCPTAPAPEPLDVGRAVGEVTADVVAPLLVEHVRHPHVAPRLVVQAVPAAERGVVVRSLAVAEERRRPGEHLVGARRETPVAGRRTAVSARGAGRGCAGPARPRGCPRAGPGWAAPPRRGCWSGARPLRTPGRGRRCGPHFVGTTKTLATLAAALTSCATLWPAVTHLLSTVWKLSGDHAW